MSLTKQQVEIAVNENYKGDYGDGLSSLADDLWGYQNEDLTYQIEGLPIIRFVESGGAEGDGAEKWVVFSVGEQLFRMTGYYSSWDSDAWDGDLEEVRAMKVQVIQYEAV